MSFNNILVKIKQRVSIPWLGVFLLCLFSRLALAIFYIEDIDSLRFALALRDYSLNDLQPHFPGYFGYFMLIKPVFWLVQNVGVSFAIMGGGAIFGLIYYSYQLQALVLPREPSNTSFLLGILLFFSPLLVLMSTRYMPDIWGLLLLVMGTYYLLRAVSEYDFRSALIFAIIVGFQGGVRLSYIPFWIPAVVLVPLFFKQIHYLILAGLGAILFWLLPMIWDTGIDNLFKIGAEHTAGHFTEWGGTVMSNNDSYVIRLVAMIESVWADGIGGWWKERHAVTLLWSLGLVVFLIKGIHLFTVELKRKVMKRCNYVISLLLVLPVI